LRVSLSNTFGVSTSANASENLIVNNKASLILKEGSTIQDTFGDGDSEALLLTIKFSEALAEVDTPKVFDKETLKLFVVPVCIEFVCAKRLDGIKNKNTAEQSSDNSNLRVNENYDTNDSFVNTKINDPKGVLNREASKREYNKGYRYNSEKDGSITLKGRKGN
jgi:hypothetical protein